MCVSECVRPAACCQSKFYEPCHVEQLCPTDPPLQPFTSLLHPLSHSCFIPAFGCWHENLPTQYIIIFTHEIPLYSSNLTKLTSVFTLFPTIPASSCCIYIWKMLLSVTKFLHTQNVLCLDIVRSVDAAGVGQVLKTRSAASYRDDAKRS